MFCVLRENLVSKGKKKGTVESLRLQKSYLRPRPVLEGFLVCRLASSMAFCVGFSSHNSFVEDTLVPIPKPVIVL